MKSTAELQRDARHIVRPSLSLAFLAYQGFGEVWKDFVSNILPAEETKDLLNKLAINALILPKGKEDVIKVFLSDYYSMAGIEVPDCIEEGAFIELTGLRAALEAQGFSVDNGKLRQEPAVAAGAGSPVAASARMFTPAAAVGSPAAATAKNSFEIESAREIAILNALDNQGVNDSNYDEIKKKTEQECANHVTELDELIKSALREGRDPQPVHLPRYFAKGLCHALRDQKFMLDGDQVTTFYKQFVDLNNKQERALTGIYQQLEALKQKASTAGFLHQMLADLAAAAGPAPASQAPAEPSPKNKY
jgi:hypothetical protein